MYNSKKISNKNFIDDSSLTKGFQPNSIIYEDPELTTTIQNDDPLLRTFQKFQKKIERGSIFNSTITLISFSPLLTIFFARFAFTVSGILFSFLLISLFAFTSFFTLYLNVKVITQTQSDNFHFLLQKKTRSKIMLKIYHLSNLCYHLSLNIIYQYMLIRMIENVFFAFSIEITPTIKITIISLLFVFVQIPYIFNTNNFPLSQGVSFILFVMIFLSTITLIFAILFFFNELNPEISLFNNMSLEYSYCICIFSLLFNNNVNLPKEIKSMNYYTYKRGKSLIERTQILEWVIYILYSLFSYLSNADKNYKDQSKDIVALITIHNEYINYLMILFKIVIIICIGFKNSHHTCDMWDTLFLLYETDEIQYNYTKIFLKLFTVICVNISCFFLTCRYILVVIMISGCIFSYILEYMIPIHAYNSIFESSEELETESKLVQPQLEQTMLKHSGIIKTFNYIISVTILIIYLFGIGGVMYCTITNKDDSLL